MKKLSSRKGFSLIELMVVMVIIGCVMGLVTVSMDHLTPSSRLGAGARRIASTVILAYNHAIVSGKYVAIYYDLDKKGCQIILHPNTPLEDTLPFQPLPQGVHYEDILVSGGNKQNKGWLKVFISPTGMMQGHVIHLKNEKAKISIEVNPISGAVEVIEGYQPLKFEQKL